MPLFVYSGSIRRGGCRSWRTLAPAVHLSTRLADPSAASAASVAATCRDGRRRHLSVRRAGNPADRRPTSQQMTRTNPVREVRARAPIRPARVRRLLTLETLTSRTSYGRHADRSPTTAPARSTSCRSRTAPIRAMDLRQIKTGAGRLRADDLRPGVHEHGELPQRDHLHRRRQGHPALPRLPDRAARRAQRLPRDGLPDPLRRAADRGAAAGLDARDHDAHDAAREREEVHGGIPLRRAPDGHLPQHGRRAVDVLSGRQEHLRQGARGCCRRTG